MRVRQLLAIVTGLMLVLSPASALAAPAPWDPPAAGLQPKNAQQQLTAAQARAEQAAETYNGASLAASTASTNSASASAAASAASIRTVQAQTANQAASTAVLLAISASAAARSEQDRTERAVAAGQSRLDAVAAAAYRSGSPLAMYGALLRADPVSVAIGQQMITRLHQSQEVILDGLEVARSAAKQAVTTALNAEQAATAGARQADRAARQVTRDADDARAAALTASHAAADSQRAAAAAATARQVAQVLVDTAERELAASGASSADQIGKAAQARLDAQADGLAGPADPTSPRSSRGSTAGATAVRWAFSQIGVPYSWGGGDARGPSRGFAQGANTIGFDCSGLTLFGWAHAGVSLGHYTGSQWNTGRHVSPIELQPGDLVFFASDTSDPTTIHHVGLYTAGGKMINAPHTGDVVRLTAVAAFGGYIGAVRPTG